MLIIGNCMQLCTHQRYKPCSIRKHFIIDVGVLDEHDLVLPESIEDQADAQN